MTRDEPGQSTSPPGADPSAPPQDAEGRTLIAEAANAIEATRQRLEEASTALAEGGPAAVATALGLSQQCADYVARALWYLWRAERERNGAAPPAP
jgi:hypothetical protein